MPKRTWQFYYTYDKEERELYSPLWDLHVCIVNADVIGKGTQNAILAYRHNDNGTLEQLPGSPFIQVVQALQIQPKC